MKDLVSAFPIQLQEALIIGQSYRFTTPVKEIKNVVLTGLGGSGIGGSIIQNYGFDKLLVPFVVNKDYFLPSFIGPDTLVIISSYSGNTEETVTCMQQAIKAKATIVCVTSGGIVAATAKKKNFDCILLPAGMPPRSCIGYSLVQALYVLAHFKLIKKDFEKDIKASIKLLNTESKDIQKKAKALAQKLHGKLSIFYSAPEFEGLAVRVCQQVNENGKMLCWHNVIPEMNHNELVGWRDKDASKCVVFLRADTDYARVQARMEICKKIIKKYTPNIVDVYTKGKSYWEKIFYFIHLTDWTSVILADLHKVDATEVKVIDYLKAELAKIK